MKNAIPFILAFIVTGCCSPKAIHQRNMAIKSMQTMAAEFENYSRYKESQIKQLKIERDEQEKELQQLRNYQLRMELEKQNRKRK